MSATILKFYPYKANFWILKITNPSKSIQNRKAQMFSQMIDQMEHKNKWYNFGSHTWCYKPHPTVHLVDININVESVKFWMWKWLQEIKWYKNTHFEHRVSCISTLRGIELVAFQISNFKLPAWEDAKLRWLHLFDFSSLCVFKCLLKSPAWIDAKSHWLHLFNFSPLCVFKCVLKLLSKEHA